MADEPIYEETETRSRRGLASFFRRIANRLGRGEALPANDEQTVTIDPPEEADLDVEIVDDDGELTLEIGLSWEGDENDVDTEAQASKARFELYEDNAEQWRWRLVHRNGNIIADSGEGYASKQKANQGLESVKKNAAGGRVLDTTRDEEPEPEEAGSNATFELFRDKEEKFRWRLVHDNGNTIADCGQGYSSKQKAKQGMNSVRTNAPGAPVETA